MKTLLRISLLLTALLVNCFTLAAEPFVVSDIRIEGLQRVSPGTLFRNFPISVGDTIDEASLVGASRSLFRTGFFSDIQLAHEDTVLVVTVEELPSISGIQLDGNKALKSEDLLDGLSNAGLAEGEIFRRATLDRLQQELTRQYISQGRYGVRVETDVERQPRNRVALSITIDEGSPAAIKKITIVGNSIYSDKELLGEFELKTTNWLSFFRNDDKYSKEKLQGDLERLESQYKDNGYINFNVESTQVSITPNKEDVYITINLVEGELFTVSETRFAGDLILPEDELNKYVVVKSGEIFSDRKVTATTEFLTTVLGNEGYTFANVNVIPNINNDENTVSLTLFIDPGKRSYVRRITFKGNTTTVDEVLRREMRQLESAWASNRRIEQSKVRLERLGFFKEVNVETPKVPGTDDQIDVEYTVEEQPSGSINASLGFSQGRGLILGAGITQNNFLGSGNQVSFGVNRSRFRESYNFSYLDPYYTVDGVSRGFNLFFRKLDFDEDNIASFTTDSFGGSVNFGYPLSETQALSFSFGYENTDITEGVFPVLEISEFLSDEGNQFDEFIVTGTWRQSTLNRGVFATRGSSQSLGLELAVPGSDIGYYRLTYNGQTFVPLTRALTLRLRTRLGYGDAYGGTSSLPFYKHFFAGGVDSVRGFENNTLGPRSTPSSLDPSPDRDPFGGNVLITGSTEIIFPVPFLKDQRSVQAAAFVDFGNVFNTECPSVSTNCSDIELDDIRYSVGVGGTWLSGFGPITVSIAVPMNEGPDDDKEVFQFSFGRTF